MDVKHEYATEVRPAINIDESRFESFSIKAIRGRVTAWATTANVLSVCLGIIYLWFGALKFIPGLSPAEVLAKSTIHQLTFGLIPDGISIYLLASWEVGLGFMLFMRLLPRITLNLAFLHIFLTFTPMLFFPDLAFTQAPLGLTLVGQYIVKNVLIIGALYVLLRLEKEKRG